MTRFKVGDLVKHCNRVYDNVTGVVVGISAKRNNNSRGLEQTYVVFWMGSSEAIKELERISFSLRPWFYEHVLEKVA